MRTDIAAPAGYELTDSGLPGLLLPGDLLVVNTTVTLPAQVHAGGGLAVHFSTARPDGSWLVELRPAPARPADQVLLRTARLAAVVLPEVFATRPGSAEMPSAGYLWHEFGDVHLLLPWPSGQLPLVVITKSEGTPRGAPSLRLRTCYAGRLSYSVQL